MAALSAAFFAASSSRLALFMLLPELSGLPNNACDFALPFWRPVACKLLADIDQNTLIRQKIIEKQY